MRIIGIRMEIGDHAGGERIGRAETIIGGKARNPGVKFRENLLRDEICMNMIGHCQVTVSSGPERLREDTDRPERGKIGGLPGIEGISTKDHHVNFSFGEVTGEVILFIP